MKQKLRHIRVKDKDGNILSKGGATVSALVDDNNVVQKVAVSWCHHRDNFNKSMGKVRATGRMNSNIGTGDRGVGLNWTDVVDEYTRTVDSIQRDRIDMEVRKLSEKQTKIGLKIGKLLGT